MYQNLANQNRLVDRFQQYRSGVQVPFQNNQLINHDIRIINTLSEQMVPNKRGENVIEQMLKPVTIGRANDDVMLSYKIREEIQQKASTGDIGIVITNAPYKAIIKEPINKAVGDITKEDLIVHKVVNGVDNNAQRFMQETSTKERERDSINKSLAIEFSIDNYNKHKKVFEYNESFIKNMAYEENLFDDSKKDCIAFYQKKQKELEDGRQVCDQVLRNLLDSGLISKDEIPS